MYADKHGNLEVTVQYSGPAVMPWLWQPVELDGDVVLVPQPIPHIAGPSGKPHTYCQALVKRTDCTSAPLSGSLPIYAELGKDMQ